jgi:hypothetical protein
MSELIRCCTQSPVFATFINSFDIVAVGAFLVSIFTLFFNMRQWSKKRRSERIVTAREMMDRVLSKQLLLDEYEESLLENPD